MNKLYKITLTFTERNKHIQLVPTGTCSAVTISIFDAPTCRGTRLRI